MQMTPKTPAVIMAMLCWLALPQAALAAAPSACGAVPDFVPVRSGGSGTIYSDTIYSIGANIAYSLRKCGPVSTAEKKSALLPVQPNPQAIAGASTVVAAIEPEAKIEPLRSEPEMTAAPVAVPAPTKPVARPTVAQAPAPSPQPVPDPVAPPIEAIREEAAYSEPSMVAPALIGLGTAAVMTYVLWEAFDDENDSPQRLTAGSEPVQALAAYDTKMLASFAALNTVADLQSDQSMAVGVSSSLYDETPAIAAGMSLRLGTQGMFKTAISFSDSEYLANAGVSYGW